MKTTPEKTITIPEITTAISTFENTRHSLYTRWDTDYEFWRMKPYFAGKGYYSYTTNSPRVLADKVLAMINEAKLNIRIPSDKLVPEERQIASNVERFLYGCINVNDERLMHINQPRLRSALAWLSLIRGGFALRIFVRKDSKGKTIPDIASWDLYNTAYGIGGDGIIWGAHTRKATRESILDEYPDLKGRLSSNDDEIKVIDYWDKKNNGVIVGDTWAKELEPHELDYCPIYIVFVGSAPSVSSNVYQETEAERSQSIYNANRLLYPIMNKTMSDLVSLVRRGVKRPKQVKSRDGKYTLDVDIDQVEKAATISTTEDVDIKPIYEEKMPGDYNALLQLIMGEQQRGGLPNVALGELGFRLSGFAINQLQGAITTVVSPFIQAIERGYTLTCDSLMNQFASGGFEPVEVMGRTSKNEIFGYPARVKIKSSDLKADWRPEVTLIPTLPKDDAQRVQLANILRMGNPPLASMDTIRDDFLNFEDPDLERDKIEEEWGAIIPIVRLQSAFKACIARGSWEKAGLILAEIQKMIAQMQAQLPQATPIRQASRLEGASMESPGAGLPAEGSQGGASSEVLPPEAGGGMPGGAVATP